MNEFDCKMLSMPDYKCLLSFIGLLRFVARSA